MNFDEVVVKESPGICRCCLSEGCYKDLGSEYTWMNETEVYADMLLDCFDIGISQHNEGPNGPKRLICEVCITRLRDACNFKKQVVDSEKRFIDMLARGEFKNKVVVYGNPARMKQESQEGEQDDIIAAEVEYLDDMEFGPSDDEIIKIEKPLKFRQSTSKASTSEEPTPKGKRGRPKKEDDGDSKPKKRKLSKGEARGGHKLAAKPNRVTPKPTCKVEHILPKPESIDKDLTPLVNITPKKGPKRLSAKDKRAIMIRNVTQVLLKTTVMPFRWLKSSYRCFYCYEIYQEVSDLKAHQNTHDESVIEKTMNNYWEPVVYLDISNMTCKLCPEMVTDLYDMIDHLVAKHEVVFNKDVGVCMVAFKLDNLNVSCLMCGATFYTFGPLLYHTNKAHKGTSVLLCDICGQHFKYKSVLRIHIKTIHESSGFLCPDCGDKFDTPAKLKTHQKSRHSVEKKYKCLVCPQMFNSHYKRSSHMATEHENRKVVKCLQCPKTFIFRSMMMTHLRDTHLKVRDHVCSVCGWRAFNSNRLKNHMFKHSGEKNFKCDVCSKAFSTKKIMKAHFARMHKAPQQPVVAYPNPY